MRWPTYASIFATLVALARLTYGPAGPASRLSDIVFACELRLCRLSLEAGTLRLHETASDVGVVASDGRRIVYDRVPGGRGGQFEVYMLDSWDSPPRRLADGEEPTLCGDSVVYSYAPPSEPDSEPGLWLWDAYTQSARELWRPEGAFVRGPACSPDARLVAAISDFAPPGGDAAQRIWVLELATRQIVHSLAPASEDMALGAVAWRDGQHLVVRLGRAWGTLWDFELGSGRGIPLVLPEGLLAGSSQWLESERFVLSARGTHDSVSRIFTGRMSAATLGQLTAITEAGRQVWPAWYESSGQSTPTPALTDPAATPTAVPSISVEPPTMAPSPSPTATSSWIAWMPRVAR